MGGAAPPLQLSDGRYLLLYDVDNRKNGKTVERNIGIAIGDTNAKEFITHRHEPLLRPETPLETKGDAELGVNNALSVCGAYFNKGTVYFAYAGAHSVILRGKIQKTDLDKYIAS